MFFLGIDQSTNSTGICLMAKGRIAHEKTVIKVPGDTTKKKYRGGERLVFVYDGVMRFIDKKTL